MSRKGPRGLTPEERKLWKRVAERTAPLHPDRPRTEPQPRLPGKPAPSAAPQPIAPFHIGEKNPDTVLSHNLSPSLGDTLDRHRNMDRKGFARLKRGKLKPEARLDLHGLTLAQAQPRLNRFILGAHAAGKRLVLIITGKGKDRDRPGPIPVRRGVLKHQVPHWLQSPPLSHVILQVSEAHLRHGGTGAYYVYLRRIR